MHKSWLQQVRHRAEYFVFRLVVCIVQAFSPSQCAYFARLLAAFIHQGLPRRWTRYGVARENLRIAFGDDLTDAAADRLIFRMWVHLFQLVGEVILLPRKVKLCNIVEAVQFRNKAQALRGLCSERPVLLLSGHVGNWEMAISIFGQFGFHMGLVARALDNPYLDRWFFNFRKYTGHRPIPKKGGFDVMAELMNRGGALALLADQDAGSRGEFVSFFGKPASTHKSIALLAIEYEALICVGYARRLEHDRLPNGWPRYEVGCEEIIDPLDHTTGDAVHEITQRFTAALERVIRIAPEQYFWVHRRWKSTPQSRSERRAAQRRKAG